MGDDQEVSAGRSSVARKVIGLVIIGLVLAAGYGLAVAGKGFEDPWIKNGVQILETVAIISFGINMLSWIPAYLFQTEKFYDLTGSLTYLSCTWYSFTAGYFANGKHIITRSLVASILVTVWALRLGSFLFTRILKDGKDDRFDEIKKNPIRFLVAWTVQGLWVFLTAYPVYIANTSTTQDDLMDARSIAGLAVWGVGFAIEVISDRQKSKWRENPDNRGKFIEEGLWYYSRHPNYFGEVTLWAGMFVFCSVAFEGTQWVAAISPVFVFCLIYFVSGVRLLEMKSDNKWGGDFNYENYKKTTSVFVILPKLGKRVSSPTDQALL